ncbi:MAG: FG-GAP repeat domain-containing protein [Bdellovibrionales bacterium]
MRAVRAFNILSVSTLALLLSACFSAPSGDNTSVGLGYYAKYAVNGNNPNTNEMKVQVQLQSLNGTHYSLKNSEEACNTSSDWLPLPETNSFFIPIINQEGMNNYYIRFKDSENQESDCELIQVLHDVTPPEIPSSIELNQNGSSTPSVSWSDSTDTGDSGISHYEIAAINQIAGTRVSSWVRLEKGQNFPNIVPGMSITPHVFSIVAVDRAGNRSASVTSTSSWVSGKRISTYVPGGATESATTLLDPGNTLSSVWYIEDFDGDGDSDMLGIDASDQLVILKNVARVFSKTVIFDTTKSFAAVAMLDLDNDGDLDLFVQSGSADSPEAKTLSALINDGTGSFSEIPSTINIDRLIAFTFSGGLGGTMGSYNIDVDWGLGHDLIVTYEDTESSTVKQFVHLFGYDAGSVVEKTSVLGVTSTNTTVIDAADIDGDNKAEILVRNFGRVFVADIKSDPATLTEVHSGRIQSSTRKDWDGDGEEDFVIVTYLSNDQVFYLKNNGDGTVTKTMLITAAGDDLGPVYYEDINGDGHTDIISTYDRDSIAWFQNNGDDTFASKVDATPYYSSFELRDIDNDGDLDIDIGTLYLNNGSGVFAASIKTGISSKILDLDGDNTLDFFVDKFHFLTNNNDGSFSTSFLVDSFGFYGGEKEDVDSDGVYDYIARVENSLYLELSNSGSPTRSFLTQCGVLHNTPTTFKYDMDADGDDDIFHLCDDKVVWIERTSNSYVFKKDIVTGPNLITSLKFLDMDLDTDIDIVAWGKESSWIRNDGADNFTKLALDSTNRQYTLSVADINGDTYPDFIETENSNLTSARVQVYINDQDGTFTTSNFNSGTNHALQVIMDHDSDGDTDFLVSNPTAQSYEVFLNDGSGGFTSEVTFSSIYSVYSIQPLEYNHDNIMDYILITNGLSAVHVSDGSGGFDMIELGFGLSFSPWVAVLEVVPRAAPLPPIIRFPLLGVEVY